MKKILLFALCLMLVSQVANSATIEIGDLSPQIQKTRTTVQNDTNSFKVPDVLAPKEATKPQESMTVTTNKQIFTPVEREVVKNEQIIDKYEETKEVYPEKNFETKTQTLKAQPVKPQKEETITQTTSSGKKETRSGHEWVFAKELQVIKKGEPFSYPIPEGAVIECYAKRVDGSIDAFEEYNDYFVMKGGELYSDTLHRLYKPEKNNELKKVDRVSVTDGGTKLKMYDPLWEKNLRHHKRNIVIDLTTGAYHMTGTQDNAMWYRNITTSGVCRVR